MVFVATATFDLRAAAAAAAAATSGVTASAVTAIPTPAFDTSSPSPGTIASANCASPEVPIPVVAIDPPVSPRHIAASSMKFTPVARSSLTGGAGAGAATVDTSVGVGVVSSSASGVGVGMKAAEVAAASALEHDAATCVICMDRMESQVLTTVCNHSFHVECLMKWQDSPCPVCRFHHNNASEASTCQVRREKRNKTKVLRWLYVSFSSPLLGGIGVWVGVGWVIVVALLFVFHAASSRRNPVAKLFSYAPACYLGRVNPCRNARRRTMCGFA